MKDLQERTREKMMRIVNDIIYMAHRIRVPSKQVKNIFIDQILKVDELREYFKIEEEMEQNVKEKGD